MLLIRPFLIFRIHKSCHEPYPGHPGGGGETIDAATSFAANISRMISNMAAGMQV